MKLSRRKLGGDDEGVRSRVCSVPDRFVHPIGHLLRAATDANPNATILTVDGIGAYDHVLRSAMLGRLAAMPSARSLLPFVRMSCAQQSCYQWFNDGGEAREVTQAEGGEQGDPLMRSCLPLASRAHWRKFSGTSPWCIPG